jgi:hypothetical protein
MLFPLPKYFSTQPWYIALADRRIDGLVKSPSAALRFTPALLDQKLRIEGIGRGSDFQEEDSSWGLSHRVNRCGVPCKYASLLSFCAPCIWSFLLCHPNFYFLRDHQDPAAANSLNFSWLIKTFFLLGSCIVVGVRQS